jgi:hypothetical protein
MVGRERDQGREGGVGEVEEPRWRERLEKGRRVLAIKMEG